MPRPRTTPGRPQVSFEIDPETRAVLDRLIEHEAAESGASPNRIQASAIRKAIRLAGKALDKKAAKATD